MNDKSVELAVRAKGWSRAVGAGCLAAVMTLTTVSSAMGAEVAMKISEFRSYLTDEHPVVQGMKASAKQLSDASSGRIRVEVTAPLRESPYAIIDLLLKGEALPNGPHLVVVPAIGLVPVEPGFNLLNLPYLMDSYEHADQLLNGPLGQELLARLEAKGLIGLAWWENGFQEIYSASKPLRKPADFADIVLRLMPESGYVDGFKALGAKVVNAPFSEVAGMLERGEIDALDSYLSQFFHTKLYESGGYLNMTGHSYSAMLVVMNRAEWEALDADTQSLLRSELPRAAAIQRDVSRKSEREATAAMAEQGARIVDDVARKELAEVLKAHAVKGLAGQDEQLIQLLNKAGYTAEATTER